MSTEIHYVVKNLAVDEHNGWEKMLHTARADAEDNAEFVRGQGGTCTVQRVTVTTEDVGLRWDDHQRNCPGPCRHLKLVDGDEFMGTINTDVRGEKWFVFLGLSGSQTDGPFDAVEDAKAAAEAAVRGTWT